MATTDPIAFGPSTALVVVDMQNDFAHPDGSLFVEGGDGLVAVINTLVGQARFARSAVVYTQDWHPPETPHFADFGGVWPVHCVRDTWGAELCDNLVVDGPVVPKGTDGEDGYSGFSMRDPTSGETTATGLANLLNSRHTETVVVVGLALDVCVKATAIDAIEQGYRVIVPPAASAPVNLAPGDGAAALAELSDLGVTLARLA